MSGKWCSLAFLCAMFFVYTVDRALLGLLAIPIQAETGMSDLRFGILNSAVFWTYAAAVPFAGLVGDRFDKRKVIGVAVLSWSIAAAFAGLACGFWSLLVIVSFAITLPQTLYGPSANAFIAKEHVGTRAIALSIHQAAYYAGWFASGLVVAATLSVVGSWRGAYVAFGALGVAVGFAFVLWTNARTSAAPEQRVSSRVTNVARSLRAFFCCPSALLAASGYVAMVFAAFGYTAWGPKFVAVKFGVSPAVAGAGVMSWHFAAAFVAILLSGLVSDRLTRRWPRFRLMFQVSVLAVTVPVLTVFGFSGSLAVVWGAAAIYGLLRGMFESCQIASIFDVGSLAPISVGWLSQRFGIRGMEIGFAMLGGALAVAAVLMLISLLFTFEKDRIKENDNA